MKFTLKKTVLATIAVAFLGISGMTTSTAKADEWVARTTEEVKDEIVHNDEGVQEYTVKYGDTLSVIAEAMDVSLDALIRVNDIQNANLIYAGTTIKFSSDKQEVVVKTEEEEHTYKVEDNTEVVEVKAVEPTPQTATSQEVQTTTTTQAAPAAPAAPAATEGYTLTVEATAYSYAEAGLSSYTADGTNLVNDPMVIAVDPRVIPLGTMVEIPGYGVFRAADTGGAIVGNKIDVHFPTVAQTYNFGRRTITIRILK